MALPCPTCRVDMDTVDFRGIMIEVCPQCAGMWFDDGELSEFLDSSPNVLQELDNKYEPGLEVLDLPVKTKMCPRGHTHLETYRYMYDSPITVDSCPVCYGVFIEDKELGDIAEFLRDEHQARLTSVMESRSRLAGHTVTSIGNRNEEETVSGLLQALTHWRGQKTAQD